MEGFPLGRPSEAYRTQPQTTKRPRLTLGRPCTARVWGSALLLLPLLLLLLLLLLLFLLLLLLLLVALLLSLTFGH